MFSERIQNLVDFFFSLAICMTERVKCKQSTKQSAKPVNCHIWSPEMTNERGYILKKIMRYAKSSRKDTVLSEEQKEGQFC